LVESSWLRVECPSVLGGGQFFFKIYDFFDLHQKPPGIFVRLKISLVVKPARRAGAPVRCNPPSGLVPAIEPLLPAPAQPGGSLSRKARQEK
jgi:hypothetical protein